MVARRITWTPDVKEEFRENFVEYFDKTTVHGLRYLVERRRPWPERVLWFLGVSVGLVACIFLMHKTYTRWRDAPVILAMDEKQHYVWQLPFPAVTVCPQAKVKRSLLDAFEQDTMAYQANRLSRAGTENLAKIQLPCGIPTVLDDDIKTDTLRTINVVENHALSKDDVIRNAFLRRNIEPDFQPILTEEGLCYSFNMMPSNSFFHAGTFHRSRDYLNYSGVTPEWCPVRGYHKDAGPMAYPMRAFGPGYDQGLILHLATKTKELHSNCTIMGQGFKVFLHSPLDFPRSAPHATFVPLDAIVQMTVKPNEHRTSAELRRGYSVKERQCYFPDERRLQFFRFYTQNNCQLECMANLTLKECSCVKFYMPRLPNTPICGERQEDCVNKAAGNMYEQSDEEAPEDKHLLNQADPPCGCLSTCSNVWYESSISHTPLVKARLNASVPDLMLKAGDLTNVREPTNFTIMMIFFADYHFLPIRRMEVFGTADLLASLGGLMGLCMGISLLSVIELFYWMLIRPFCQRIKQRNPDLRSIRIPHKNRVAPEQEASVQYSRHTDDDRPATPSPQPTTTTAQQPSTPNPP